MQRRNTEEGLSGSHYVKECCDVGVLVPLLGGVPGVIRNLGCTDSAVAAWSFSQADAGTTRGERIKANMSDKHELQALMPFIPLRLIKMPGSVTSRPSRSRLNHAAPRKAEGNTRPETTPSLSSESKLRHRPPHWQRMSK